MKTNTILVCAAALLAGNFTSQARDVPGIWTTFVPVNDAPVPASEPPRLLNRTDDPNYADEEWHRLPGRRLTVKRTVWLRFQNYPAHFVTEKRNIASAPRNPAERAPKIVWSHAFNAYVPYPVDRSLLKPEPERELAGYTSIKRVVPPQPEPVQFRPAPSQLSPSEFLPPVAEGPPRVGAPPVAAGVRKSAR